MLDTLGVFHVGGTCFFISFEGWDSLWGRIIWVVSGALYMLVHDIWALEGGTYVVLTWWDVHLMSRVLSKQLRYADETYNAHALLVRFLCTDMQHRCSSVGFYFQRLLINQILCISIYMVGEFMETVHMCIRWLARECFVWAMQSAGVDFFWLYADTSQSEDFDLKLHFY